MSKFRDLKVWCYVETETNYSDGKFVSLYYLNARLKVFTTVVQKHLTITSVQIDVKYFIKTIKACLFSILLLVFTFLLCKGVPK